MKFKTAADTRKYTNAALMWNPEGTRLGVSIDGKQLEFSEWPNWVNPNLPNQVWNLKYRGTVLERVSPTTGIFTAQFLKFSHKENELPAPREMEDSFGKFPGFYAIIKIVGMNGQKTPALNGMTDSFRLKYERISNENGVVTFEVGPRGLTKSQTLMSELFEATGILHQDFPYQENMLPLWEAAMDKDAEFQIIYKGGWVKQIIANSFGNAPKKEEPKELPDDFLSDSKEEKDGNPLGEEDFPPKEERHLYKGNDNSPFSQPENQEDPLKAFSS